MIEIRKSNIHGVGVFALQDIPALAYITKYPTHYSVENRMLTGYISREGKTDEDILKMYESYGLTIGNKTIVGDKDIYSPEECGHMFNDTTKIDFPDKDKLSNRLLKKLVRDYYMECNKNRNCCCFNGKVYATRDIKKGEELTWCYGAVYWYIQKYNYTDKDLGSISDKINRIKKSSYKL